MQVSASQSWGTAFCHHKALGLPSKDLHNRKIHLEAICSSFTGDIRVCYLSHLPLLEKKKKRWLDLRYSKYSSQFFLNFFFSYQFLRVIYSDYLARARHPEKNAHPSLSHQG